MRTTRQSKLGDPAVEFWPSRGHINRLKMLKRQMFGRAHLDLLSRRFLGATWGPGHRPTGASTMPEPAAASRDEASMAAHDALACLHYVEAGEGVAGHSRAVQTNGVPAEAAVTGGQYVSSPTYWACTACALSFDYHQNGP